MKQFLIFGVFYQIMINKKISAKEIAQKYEVSPRTIYRYIESICEAGVPVCSKTGKNGGFYFDDSFECKSFLENCDFKQ